ncbi:hypothetical protein [Paraburkholderia solisilvae]|nr:hypothetical protein [Paraburkholderia solisilvae]
MTMPPDTALTDDKKEEIQDSAEEAVMERINQANEASVMAGFKAPKGNEKVVQIAFRRGLCGECCAAVKARLDTDASLPEAYNIVDKLYNGDSHFFLETIDGNRVIEPTWKQIVVSKAEEDGSGRSHALALSDFPNVFVGTKEELKDKVVEACNLLKKPKESGELLKHWGIEF